jgi:hypothetical protein
VTAVLSNQVVESVLRTVIVGLIAAVVATVAGAVVAILTLVEFFQAFSPVQR